MKSYLYYKITFSILLIFFNYVYVLQNGQTLVILVFFVRAEKLNATTLFVEMGVNSARRYDVKTSDIVSGY